MAREDYKKRISNKNDPVRGQSPAISIIIPARNEEKNITFLLDSLEKQSLKPYEIIVVDDESSDRTKDLACHLGVRLIEPGPLPEGWTGKAHACYQGARAASGEVLLFLDADTRLEADALEILLGLFQRRKGFLSIQPYHLMAKSYERLSAFFNLILFLNMNISSYVSILNRPRGAFGPCLICRRADYLSLGGHEAIRGDIIDDMALARLALKRGWPVSCYAGKGVVSFRMYPGGLKHLVEGWTKNFATGASRTSLLLFLVSFGWVAGAMSGPVDIIRGVAAGPDVLWQLGLVLYLIFSAQVYYFLKKLGNFGVLTAVLYPFHLLFFILVFVRSLIFTHLLGFVYWKGRKIKLKKKITGALA